MVEDATVDHVSKDHVSQIKRLCSSLLYSLFVFLDDLLSVKESGIIKHSRRSKPFYLCAPQHGVRCPFTA